MGRGFRFVTVGWAYLITVLTGLALPFPSHAHTLPVSAGSGFPLLFWFAMVVLTATTFVEAEIIWRVVRKPVGVWSKIVEWSFLINLVTLIPTAVLVLLMPRLADVSFGPSRLELIPAVLVSGLLVIVPEFLLLLWLFRRLYRRGSLKEPISPSRVAATTLAANLGSLLLLECALVLLAGPSVPGFPPYPSGY